MNAYQIRYKKYILVQDNEIILNKSEKSNIINILKLINLECLEYLVEQLCCDKEFIIQSNKELFLRKNSSKCLASLKTSKN